MEPEWVIWPGEYVALIPLYVAFVLTDMPFHTGQSDEFWFALNRTLGGSLILIQRKVMIW